jgi:hypothetical protein
MVGFMLKKEDYMRYAKICLIAVAVASLMALGGAGTASAKSTELFSGATTLTAGTTVTWSLSPGSSILTSSTSGGLIQTCTTSAIDGKTNQTTVVSGPITLTTEELTFGGPTDPCSFEITPSSFGNLGITNNGGTLGTVTGSGSVVTIAIAGATCLYGTGTGTHLGTTNGATMSVNAVINEQEPKKLLCPDTTIWTASYVITTPVNLRIEE